MGKVQPTGYWTFFCNPAKWEADRFLSSGIEAGGYLITHWQADWFQPGQRGVLRVGTDQRSLEVRKNRPRLKPGIYAIVEVLSRARNWSDGDRYWLEQPPADGQRLCVDIRFERNLLLQPLLILNMRGVSGIDDPYLLNGFQASTMPLKARTFQKVLSLSGKA